VVSPSASALQSTLDHLVCVAGTLGLKFNSDKCASLSFVGGKPNPVDLTIQGGQVRCLGSDDQEPYLGIPIGAKLRFRPSDNLISHLDKIAESLLAPWQKLEVFRSHLLPSLSHHLASGRVRIEALERLDIGCRKFLAHIAMVPSTTTVPFYYADRRAGGLGTFRLVDEAYIWTLARAVQLLTSRDELVRSIFKEQLYDTILRAFEKPPAILPVNEYLSGSKDRGLYRLQEVRGGENLWTLARRAAKRLRARIDVSGDESLRIIADDVSVLPPKAVRGLRTVVRQRHTREFLIKPHQGRVAAALALDTATNDMARLISCWTELGYLDWKYLHAARIDMLPLRGYSWSTSPDRSCRHCHKEDENAFHVINNCQRHLQRFTQRHDGILDLLDQLLTRRGYAPAINRAPPGQRLRPDVEFQVSGSRLMIDVAVSFDHVGNLEKAYNRKSTKYQHMGKILPLVVGSLGAWYPRNDDIRSLLGIDGRSWTAFRRKARLLAIKGSMEIVREHLTFAEGDP